MEFADVSAYGGSSSDWADSTWDGAGKYQVAAAFDTATPTGF